VKPHLPHKVHSLSIFGFNHGHAAENAVSHKYDVTKGITIRSAFLAKAFSGSAMVAN